MSERELDPREEALLSDALDALDGGTAPDLGDREVLELWGVLAAALEPLEPRAGARERLLEQARAGDVGPRPVPLASRDRQPTRISGGLERLALAASVLVALGLGVVVIATTGENGRLRERLAGLERLLERESLGRRVAEVELAGARERLGLVTATNTEICPLKPPSDASQSGARGVLWIAANHQHWHLTVEGLEAEEGYVFELWFLVGEERAAVSAGTFRAVAGERIELGSPEMPAQTRAVAITLELVGGGVEPKGPVVLFGDEVLRMI